MMNATNPFVYRLSALMPGNERKKPWKKKEMMARGFVLRNRVTIHC
jgi:hypothetical protein